MPQLICLHLQKPGAERFYFWLLFGLWKAKHFHQFLTGSVIPFIRLSDLKNEVFNQAEKVSEQEKEYKSTVDKI